MSAGIPAPANAHELAQLLSPALLADVKRIELVTRRKIDTGMIGNYRSAFRGSGLVFADLREYQPGDDVKHIHWKVSARTGRVFVKSYDEDRQLRVLVAVDVSSSTAAGVYRAQGFRSRQQRAIECAALITLLGARSDDAVGLALFSNRIEEYIRPRRNRLQTQSILLSLMRSRTLTPATDLRAVLTEIRKLERRPAILFIISDFYCPPFEEELRALTFTHDVILLLLDQSPEEELPSAGLVEFVDAESVRRVLVDTSSQSGRQMLRRIYEQRIDAIRRTCERVGVDLLRVSGNPLAPLAELMRRRTARMR